MYYIIIKTKHTKKGETHMKHFKTIKSYDDPKTQYKALLKANHPDNGGDLETMKEINVEYGVLFHIWKDRQEKETGEQIKETAESTRRQFYTANGWEGSRYDSKLTLKEIAQIVRAYVKEKYPTYKFSVRTSYASMCQELHVDLKESPMQIYKAAEELDSDDRHEFWKKAERNGFWTLNSWNNEDFAAEYNRITSEHGNFYKVLNGITKAVAEDVDSFVKSYNYDDSDGMTDYFDVNFYYFGCCRNNGENVKVVPKTARIKNTKSELEKANSKTQNPISDTEITDSETEKAIPAPDADQTSTNTKKKGVINMTRNEIRVELKNLFNSILMSDESDEIDLIMELKGADLQEEVDYLRRLKDQAGQAERTVTDRDDFLKYRHRRETLVKILEIIYLYF